MMTRDGLLPLLELQRIDSAIDRLDARRADLPEEAARAEKQQARDEAAAQMLDPQTRLDDVTRDLTRVETEASQVETKRAHEAQRANSVTNAREAAHIQAELDALGRRFSALEDRELELMEEKETLEEQVAALQASLDAAEAALTDATQARDAATVEIDRERAEQVAARDAILPQVAAELLAMYEETRPKKNGVAVAAMESWTCRACGLEASPSEKERLRNSTELVERCENCSRILVFV